MSSTPAAKLKRREAFQALMAKRGDRSIDDLHERLGKDLPRGTVADLRSGRVRRPRLEIVKRITEAYDDPDFFLREPYGSELTDPPAARPPTVDPTLMLQPLELATARLIIESMLHEADQGKRAARHMLDIFETCERNALALHELLLGDESNADELNRTLGRELARQLVRHGYASPSERDLGPDPAFECSPAEHRQGRCE